MAGPITRATAHAGPDFFTIRPKPERACATFVWGVCVCARHCLVARAASERGSVPLQMSDRSGKKNKQVVWVSGSKRQGPGAALMLPFQNQCVREQEN